MLRIPLVQLLAGSLLACEMMGVSVPANEVSGGIRVDGKFGDWQRYDHLTHEDPSGDGWSEGLDFEAIGASVGPDGLSLYLRTAEPFVIGRSSLQIRIDSDGDGGTGGPWFDMGSDVMLSFAPSQLDLRFYPAEAVFHTGARLPAGEFISDLIPNGLNAISTHPASREYELMIPLQVLPGVRGGGQIGISVRDGSNAAGDLVPDFPNTFRVDVPPYLEVEYDVPELEKRDPGDLRIASWNVLHDGPTDPDKEAAFGRQLVATQPDIVGFQEMWDTGPAWVRAFMNRWLPLDGGAPWFAVGYGDSVIASRFPIKRLWTIEPRNLLVWVDTKDTLGMDVLFISAHTKAFEEFQDRRRRETDTIVQLIQRLRLKEDPNGPQEDFALFAVGDYNANSPKLEITQLRTGTLMSQSQESQDFWPDAYGRPLVDAAPRHTHRQRISTWHSLASGNTQRLDYIFYSETSVTKQRSYTLETSTMPSEFRTRYGLEQADSRISDHLLMIADFRAREVDYAWHAVDKIIDGSFHSEWFGQVQVHGMPFIWTATHGNMYALPEENGIWIWDTSLGWWFTNWQVYPFAWSHGEDSWLYFKEGVPGLRSYYNFSTASWTQLPLN